MKTNNIFGVAFLLLVLISPACHLFDDDDILSPPCNIGVPFTLWYSQSTDCEDWSITFYGEIQDSRCPTTVTCVWEGRVDVELQVGDDLISLGLPDDATLGRSKDTLGNSVIELLEVLPAPVAPQEIPKGVYRVKLLVTDL